MNVISREPSIHLFFMAFFNIIPLLILDSVEIENEVSILLDMIDDKNQKHNYKIRYQVCKDEERVLARNGNICSYFIPLILKDEHGAGCAGIIFKPPLRLKNDVDGKKIIYTSIEVMFTPFLNFLNMVEDDVDIEDYKAECDRIKNEISILMPDLRVEEDKITQKK